jgi:hypothetical protein
MEARALDPRPVIDRDASGYDFIARVDDEPVIVRCETGDEPVDIGIGRELTACLAETGATRALLVSEAGASEALAAYLLDRPIEVVAPSRMFAEPAVAP